MYLLQLWMCLHDGMQHCTWHIRKTITFKHSSWHLWPKTHFATIESYIMSCFKFNNGLSLGFKFSFLHEGTTIAIMSLHLQMTILINSNENDTNQNKSIHYYGCFR